MMPLVHHVNMSRFYDSNIHQTEFSLKGFWRSEIRYPWVYAGPPPFCIVKHRSNAVKLSPGRCVFGHVFRAPMCTWTCVLRYKTPVHDLVWNLFVFYAFDHLDRKTRFKKHVSPLVVRASLSFLYYKNIRFGLRFTSISAKSDKLQKYTAQCEMLRLAP